MNYDMHTSYEGYFTNLIENENKYLICLREFHKKIYQHANFTAEGLIKNLSTIHSIIQGKFSEYPARNKPSLLDKSFAKLADGIAQFEKELKMKSQHVYQTSMTQRFFHNYLD